MLYAKISHALLIISRVAENGDIDTLKAFIKCNFHPQNHIAVLAAFHGRKRLLEYLIETVGVDKDTRDLYERTPLLRAIEGGRGDVVK